MLAASVQSILTCRVTLMRMVTREVGSGASLLNHTQSLWQTNKQLDLLSDCNL